MNYFKKICLNINANVAGFKVVVFDGKNCEMFGTCTKNVLALFCTNAGSLRVEIVPPKNSGALNQVLYLNTNCQTTFVINVNFLILPRRQNLPLQQFFLFDKNYGFELNGILKFVQN